MKDFVYDFWTFSFLNSADDELRMTIKKFDTEAFK